MRIISAKKLTEALTKAQGVGLVEERVIIGDCELVLRNLRPDEYEAIVQETKALEDLAYLNGYQRGHVCRAIVEINGEDLRGVRFVEVDEPDPKNPDRVRSIKLELHDYLNKYVIASWSKEALFTAYRKVGDVVTVAEQRAKEGITFRIPEESPEDRLRRLVGEIHEVSEDVPAELFTRILEDAGLVRKTTLREVENVDTQLRALAEEQAAQEAPPAPEPAPQPPEPPATEPQSPEALMRKRVPLNQLPISVPPVVRTPPPEPSSQSPALSRSAKIAAIEGDLVDSAAVAGPPVRMPAPQEVAELAHKAAPINAREAAKILDAPPAGGINPRFRPQSR